MTAEQKQIKKDVLKALNYVARGTNNQAIKKLTAAALDCYQKNLYTMGNEKVKALLPHLVTEDNAARKTIKCYKILAVVCVMRYSYEEAIDYYNCILKINNHDAKAYGERAFCKFNSGQYQPAIADYDRALQLNPTEQCNRTERKLVLAHLNREKAEIELLKTGQAENSADPYPEI